MAISTFSSLKQNQASPFNGAVLLSSTEKTSTFRLANGNIATVSHSDPLWAQIFKGIVSGAVGLGFGALGLSALAPEAAAGLGITGGAEAGAAGAVPIEAAGSGLSLGGSGAAASAPAAFSSLAPTAAETVIVPGALAGSGISAGTAGLLGLGAGAGIGAGFGSLGGYPAPAPAPALPASTPEEYVLVNGELPPPGWVPPGAAAGGLAGIGAGFGLSGLGSSGADMPPALAPETVVVPGEAAPPSSNNNTLTDIGVGGLAGVGAGAALSNILSPSNTAATPAANDQGKAAEDKAAAAAAGTGAGLTLSDTLKALSAAGLIGTAAAGLGNSNLGTTSSTSTQVLSPEQIAYLKSQQALADKQLAFLDQQGTFQQSYLTSIQPLLDQQAKLMQQQYDAAAAAQNDPINQQIQQRSADLLQQQIASQNDLAPLQKQLLQAQLDQAINGGRPTPEQIASIDAATKAAYATGSSQINDFSTDALRQLRENLAPSLGLRPSDTPILDRGALIEKNAGTQLGQLSSSLATANANSRLNLPLAQQQVGNATAQNTDNIARAAQDFQAQLAQNAIQNRLNLLGAGRNATDIGLTSGSNLVKAASGNTLGFGSSTTSTTSNPGAGLSSLLGGIGGLATGLGSLGLFGR